MFPNTIKLLSLSLSLSFFTTACDDADTDLRAYGPSGSGTDSSGTDSDTDSSSTDSDTDGSCPLGTSPEFDAGGKSV